MAIIVERVEMKARELVEWLADEYLGRKIAGMYLAGYLHGQVGCESRLTNSLTSPNMPYDLDVAQIVERVTKAAIDHPDNLDLDVPTFMYAVFDELLRQRDA